jgi:hypothetical protein
MLRIIHGGNFFYILGHINIKNIKMDHCCPQVRIFNGQALKRNVPKKYKPIGFFSMSYNFELYFCILSAICIIS